MRKVSYFGAAGLLVVLVAGCAPVSGAADPLVASPSTGTPPTPTPTIPVGPIELTEEQAAERYLGIVCSRNGFVNQLNDAISAGEDDYLNGGDPSVAEINEIAKKAMVTVRKSVEVADDAYYTWPSAVAADIKTVRDAQLAEGSTLSSLTNADTFEEAYYVTWPNQDEAAAAGQEVRYQLGIDSDTDASCEGYESATEELHQEMTTRQKYLNSFTDNE